MFIQYERRWSHSLFQSLLNVSYLSDDVHNRIICRFLIEWDKGLTNRVIKENISMDERWLVLFLKDV